MTKKELAEMKEREQAASKGPWFRGFKDGSGNGEDEWREEGAYITVHTDNEDPTNDEDVIVRGGDYEGIPIGVLKVADAEFIINARKDMPKLIKEVERLSMVLGKIKAETEALDKAMKRTKR